MMEDRQQIETLWALVESAIDDWPQFDEPDEHVNGGDLVDWFDEWRLRARKTLSRLAHDDKS